MSTGTIQKKAPKYFMDIEYPAITVSFVNDSGEDLTQGQEVIIKPDGTIDKRSAGNEYPLGTVVVGNENGGRVTVNVNAQYTALSVAAETLVPGDFVFQNGTKDPEGYPKYAKCAAGEFATAIVMKGGLVDAEIKIVIMRNVVVAV